MRWRVCARSGWSKSPNERLIAHTLADYPEYHSSLSDLFVPLKRPPRIAEEHDSATSLIASVEAGRGVALVQQGFDCLTGPRLKVRPLTPAPPPLVVGVAYRKENNSGPRRISSLPPRGESRRKTDFKCIKSSLLCS